MKILCKKYSLTLFLCLEPAENKIQPNTLYVQATIYFWNQIPASEILDLKVILK